MQNKQLAVKYLLSLKVFPIDLSISGFVLGTFVLSEETVLEIFLRDSMGNKYCKRDYSKVEAKVVEIIQIHLLFNKKLGPDLSPQSCLYFRDFQGSKLLTVA